MKKTMKRALLLVTVQFCLLPAVNVFADVVTLKNGRQILGSVDSGGTREIQVRKGETSQSVPVDQIQSIQFGSAEGFSLLPPGQSVTLPAGTQISIRTSGFIDSKTADTSKEYPVSVEDPVTINGVLVVPANAQAFLRVADVNNPRLGRASLSTVLVAVTRTDGQRVDLRTDKVDSRDVSHLKRTLAQGAAGAGTGAVIGAVAGGAAGAGIGAAVGGATGAIAGRMMGGKGAEIPSETRFTYTLAQPVVINYQGGGQ
jgi:hypothetical protein